LFPEINQPQCDNAHQRNRRTQACRSFELEPFRADTAFESFMKLCNQPSR